MTILLLDDDKDFCQLTKKVLTTQGYNVDAFYDADAALQHVKTHKPNLILMDIMLPHLSGPEVVKILKNDPQSRQVPVIFLTGLVTSNEKNVEDEGISVSGVLYPTLGKPYEIDRLLSVVKRYAK